MGSLSDSSSLRTENNRIRLSPNNLEGIKIENPNAEREVGKDSKQNQGTYSLRRGSGEA
jgi:hypothetical protein